VLAPADDYVAEFVRHMNPLTVLTGGMIMRRRSQLAGENGHVWLDLARRYRLSLGDSDEPLGVHLDGVAQDFCHIEEDAGVARPPAGLAVAPAAMSLQSIIHLRQSTGHPVLLAESGRIIGVCSETEIIEALAGARHTNGAPAT
jgi:glycine betaine/proline transport system ATP-binding protein